MTTVLRTMANALEVDGTITDQSGAVTVGGTSQQVMAANPTRRYLFVQNLSDTVMYLNFTDAATADDSIMLAASGGAFEMKSPGFVSTEAIKLLCATTGKKFVAKEG